MMIKSTSTFDRIMADPKQKVAFEKEYANFLQSEMKLQKALAEGEPRAKNLPNKAAGFLQRMCGRNSSPSPPPKK